MSSMLVASLFALPALLPDDAVRIVIDGRFDDWATVPAVVRDPFDAPQAPVDFGEIRVSADGRSVSFLLDLGHVVNVQRLDGTLRLLLDTDGDTRTGRLTAGLEGTDLVIELTPPDPDGGHGGGVGLVVIGADQPASPYDVGFLFAPTYASRMVELGLDRGADLPGAPPILRGRRFRGLLVYTDPDGEPGDRTDSFDYALPPAEHSPLQQPADPLARRGARTLRVVSWNLDFGGLFRTPELYGRLLLAIDPDVILFQELTDRTTKAKLRAFLERVLPRRGQAWTVIVGEGGGDLRTAVAGPAALAPVEELRIVPYPDRPQTSIRVAAGALGHRGRRLLVASVHLTCCGRAGSFADRTRQVEADAIRRAIGRALSGGRFDGVVVAGDLNLVGSRRPLDLAAEGLDADGALAIAEAVQLDGRTNATWSNPSQPFTPGRLDFLLYSGSTLGVADAYVLDTRDLVPRWQRRHRLQPADTMEASDHLPLVVDLAWRDHLVE